MSLAACTSSTEPTKGGTGIHFSGSAGAADTVDALLPQALLIEIRDSTGAIPPTGTIVRFTCVYDAATHRAETLIAPLTSALYTSFATTTTDGDGRTAVLIQLGTVAGTAHLVVGVPTLGLQDTARFTVNAGRAAQLFVSPIDTVLYVGKAFTPRVRVADYWGNPRTDAVTWSSSESGIKVTGSGVVTGATVGRYHFTATSGDAIAEGGVSIVPQAQFVGWSGFSYGAFTIVTLDADGSKLTTLASGVDGGIGAHPAWIPGTSKVVYTSSNGTYQVLYTVGTGGAPTPFFAAAPPTVTHQAEPTPSADGRWLYFSAFDSRCSAFDYCVSRAKIDGSEPELLVATPSRNPAPSPDGSKVAYVAGGRIRVLDVTNRTTSSWSVAGTLPSWSPDGTLIAYVSGSGLLSFIAPDGTGVRTPSPPALSAWPPAWTPDSKWVVEASSYAAAFVNATNDVTLPLPYAANKIVVTSVR